MGKSAKGKELVSTNKKKPLHPNSRKAAVLSKQITRETKLDRLRGQKNMKLQVLGIKVSFFHENFDQSLTSCTPQYLHELIEKYIRRNDEELASLHAKRIKYGNAKMNFKKEDTMRFNKKREKSEYESTGFEMVNLFDQETFLRFKAWEGDIRFLSAMKLKNFLKKDLLRSQ